MERIEHSTVFTNGINMHLASIGTGPVILFVHGFPELWYSWRHQLLGLSALGYRAIAPDLRGYGDTDAPSSIESYTILHIVGDLVGLLDKLGIDQVFLVGHDWGAFIAWHLCMLRPDRVKALVNMSVALTPRNPERKPVESFRDFFGDDYYICRFQKPGEIEEEFAQVDAVKLMTSFFALRDPGPLLMPKGLNSRYIPDKPLPSWMTEEDIKYYSNKFSQKGFTGGLNYYRTLDLSWELLAPWTDVQVKVPVKFMIGELDLTNSMPGVNEHIHRGGLKKLVPFLQEIVVMEGVAHFINQEKAKEVNEHIYNFFQKF